MSPLLVKQGSVGQTLVRDPGFRGGLVFKAHRLLHHATLVLRVTKKKKKGGGVVQDGREARVGVRRRYRGTSLIRNSALLGPYSRTMPCSLGLRGCTGWTRSECGGAQASVRIMVPRWARI